ncbi:MAG: SoxR reducing system RseC family protein [Desulfobacteraceae bacterium]|jgi:sigma-E factor negative regulatory protein RseC
MAIEQGIVILPGAANSDTVWVEIVPPAACAACASRKNCSVAGSDKTRKVEVVNLAGAKVGDRVQISIKTSALLKAIFLLYLFPILCMLSGGLAGQIISRTIGTNESITSMIAAVGCFVAAMAVVRIRGGRMALRSDYQPKIKRILPQQPKNDGELKTPDKCSLNANPPN